MHTSMMNMYALQRMVAHNIASDEAKLDKLKGIDDLKDDLTTRLGCLLS